MVVCKFDYLLYNSKTTDTDDFEIFRERLNCYKEELIPI